MQLKQLIPKPLRALGRKAVNAFTLTETIDASKKKWNTMAEKNARYFVMTDFGEKISEEQFHASGRKDFDELVLQDKILATRLIPFKEKTVLEIGAGCGRITEFFADYFKEVAGVDISESMIAQGKERLAARVHSKTPQMRGAEERKTEPYSSYSEVLSDEGNKADEGFGMYSKNVELFATDGLHIPLPDNSRDFVFSFIVFQHMPDKETIKANLKEIGRVLKTGGIAKIQLRGLPTSKKNWFYGPSFESKNIPELIQSTGLSILQTSGGGSRYFWVWLERK